MDSPVTAATTAVAAAIITTASSSSSPKVQESPFSNYASNLSPIKPVKSLHVSQAFIGLNSPPLVFTSPRINETREMSFLKRLQCQRLSSAGNNGGQTITEAPGDLETPDLLLHSGLIANTQKDSDTKNSVQVQPSGSSGSVDEYFADPVELNCASSAYAVNPDLKPSTDVLRTSPSSITDSKRFMSNFDGKSNMSAVVDAPVAIYGQAEENIRGNLTFDEEEQTYRVWPSNECLNIESNLSVDHDSRKRKYENSGAQDVGNAHGDESDPPHQLPPEPLHIDKTTHDPQASQHQRGMSRRCLQFEEVQPKAFANSTSSSRSPATPEGSESWDSSHVDLNAPSIKRQRVDSSHPGTPMFPPHHRGKSPLTVSKPSGIGLHLNSIGLPMGHSATAGGNIANAEYGMLETKAAESSMISESFDPIGPSNLLQLVDHHETTQTKRKFDPGHADIFELNQLSPKKKRKKSSTIDGDGCKRCNCKKTKCLKLYCDCFAAGIYCAEPCACQGCFNRPEYEDTVLETRQQIESRNPLAFAPKIIQRVTEGARKNGDDGNRVTPSSAKHKRGCNCKKSMCLKKYCECYQANVGCSNGCRCEGCKNVFGTKEEYVEPEEMVGGGERSEGTFNDKLEMAAYKKDLLHAELYDAHNLTPVTPSFQYSDHGNSVARSQLLSSRCAPSPESDLTILSSYAKTTRSLRSLDSNDMLLETSKEIQEVGSYGRGMDYNNADMMDHFSSRSGALANLSHLSPLPNFPSTAMASSASSKAMNLTNIPRLQLCPRSGSLRWHSSPVSPMTQQGGTKNIQGHDSDNALKDDTPEILKDASTPIKSVQVSSPNRKRVSPPHGRLQELGSGGSGALKSGRKFILRAVPSFPPLTPNMDCKGLGEGNGPH